MSVVTCPSELELRVGSYSMVMTPERWDRVKSLYDAAHAQPQAERVAFWPEPPEVMTNCAATFKACSISRSAPQTCAFRRWSTPGRQRCRAESRGPKIWQFRGQDAPRPRGHGRGVSAHDTRLGRDVAIKCCRRRLPLTRAGLQASSAKRVWSPH